MLPLISIIINNYNREFELGNAIASILNQTWRNLELLVWDDGSTDNSVKIALQYAQKDSRVKVISATHQGREISRKQAISKTQGIFISFVNSDDIFQPQAIENTIVTLKQDLLTSHGISNRRGRRERRVKSFFVVTNHPISAKPQKSQISVFNNATKTIKSVFWQLTPYIISLLGIFGTDIASAQQIVPNKDTGTNVNTNGNTININGGTTAGANLFHSFQEFGLTQGQIANFLSQPNIQNILGRITGGNVSIINGLIQVTGSNANLYLMNPAGFIFGNNASLNVPAAFTATTANGIGFGENWLNAFGTNDYSVLVGNPDSFAFTMNQQGAIINSGNLAVGTGQSLNFLGGTVVNTGQLSAPEGQITVTSVPGENLVRLSQPGNLLSLEIQPFSGQNQPNNPTLSVASLPELLTVGNTGLTANSDGTIQVTGSNVKLPTTPGTTIVSGNVNVSGNTGGQVNILGNNIGLINANINASGTNGGGKVLVGGDLQGQGKLPNATNTYVDNQSLISLDSTNSGNGGLGIIWADNSTKFFSNITARGGVNGGNGGFVEVSGKNYLTFNGSVDTTAVNGQKGTLLLDPTTITIIDAPANEGSFDSSFTGTIASGDADNGANTISWGTLVDISRTASIDLQATGDITINPITGETTGINDGRVNLFSESSLGSSASFSLTSTTGAVNFVDTNNTIVTNGGSVNISGASLNLGNFDTSSNSEGNGTVNGGNFTLSASGDINVGNINTSETFSDFTTDALTGGDVNITSTNGSITAGSINSSVIRNGGGSFVGRGGAVSLSARENITVKGAIDTSVNISPIEGTVDISGGNVSLTTTNPFGSTIQFDTINSQVITSNTGSLVQGGNVEIITNGLIQGTGASDSFNNTIATGAFENTGFSIPTLAVISGAGGTITLQHDGGADNVPFIVGSTGVNNGTIGTLSRGDEVLSSGSFPVLPNGGDATGTPTGITITSVNTPPTIDISSTVSLVIESGQSETFTFNSIVGDVNGDNTTVTIDTILAGTLQRGDTILSAGDTVSTSETLTYTPPANTEGTIDAFTVSANDGVSSSLPQTLAIDVIPSSDTPDPPDPDPCIFQCKKPPDPDPKPPEENPPTTPDPIPEDKFTDSFTNQLGIPAPQKTTTINEAGEIAANIEKATGVKPAFIYLSFVPVEIISASVGNKQSKLLSQQATEQLEIVVVTGTGKPIRKRVPNVTKSEILKVAKEFRQQVVAPQYRTRTTYLKPAQKLYSWIIEPIEADLQTQGIQNLVFLPDVGLRSTPIAALHDGQQFLVEKYSIGLMPSLSLTNTLYTDIKKSQVLAMGVSQSTQGQEPLPAVPLEITTLINKLWPGKLLLNQQATIDNLQSLRRQQPFGIIHLATHADFLSGSVDNSYIQLWENKLRLNQIRQLGFNNPQVEMLVLSACRSALGNEEAEIGFAGLAVLAGVKTSVASLWAVGDTGTAALMTKFYESLKTSPIRADALRQAQVAMAKGQVYLKDGKLQGIEEVGSLPLPTESIQRPNQSLAHPYYWAAFTMVGNPW